MIIVILCAANVVQRIFFVVFFRKHAEISVVFYFTSLTYASLNGILCTVKGRLL